MLKILKSNWLLIIIVLTGLFLRSYRPLTLFQYSHDQDLAGWIVRDILYNHHLRLIGQETSSHGIFIGPYFYYLLIPFYLLTHMDPSGTLLLPILLGTFAVFSTYFTFSKMFNKQIGLIGAIIFAFSALVVFTDREVVPTMPVMLWTIWFLYSLHLILRGNKLAYPLLGFLIGLIWSINLQLIILMPLTILALFISRQKINQKYLIISIFAAVILNIPFIAFEVRHGFQQTRALVASLTTTKDYVTGTATGFLPRLDRTMQLVYKNSTNLFGLNVININTKIIFWLSLLILLIMIYKKAISWQLGGLLYLWQAIYILFFTKISLNISEYYLNGMLIVWILIIAIFLSVILKQKITALLSYCLIGLFIVLNLSSFFNHPINASGYIQRKAIISYIKNDANKHNFPCVSLSFITSPGNNLGYRYFTWELGLKTKPISKEVPVYSVVFPLSMVNGFDKSFGALGLVLPDYSRYNLNTVKQACEGDDYTLTEPMFGFTN